MVTEKDILQALHPIMDPDFNKSIVDLGFIKNIRITDDLVAFDIELTTAACPVKAEFQKEAEKRVLDLAGINHVNVNMTARKGHTQKSPGGLAKVSNIIAVSSCKGGVGKSTIAAHLAKNLAQRGFKTGLLDADVFGPSVPTLFDMHPKGVHVDKNQMIIPFSIDSLQVMSFGFVLGEGPAVMRGPMVSGYMNQILHQVHWGELDYLILDLPPGTGDIQLTITQSVALTGAVIVTTGQSLSLVDVARGIEMFEKVDVPMLGIIENMSWFECDNCSKRHYIFGSYDQIPVSERFGLDLLAQLPIEKHISEAFKTQVMNNEHINSMVDNVIRALGKRHIEDTQPTVFTHDTENIQISWPDGAKQSIPNRTLRLACRCALCIDEYTGEKKLDETAVPDDIQAIEIQQLGNYAVKIDWSDGHDTGIYPFKQLKEMALR